MSLNLKNSAGREVHEGNGPKGAGRLYCGVRFAPNHGCPCGTCDGQCGPNNGCACPECRSLLEAILDRAALKCDSGHAMSRMLVRDLKRRMGYEDGGHCDRCGGGITNDFEPILHCPEENFDLCAKCSFAAVPGELKTGAITASRPTTLKCKAGHRLEDLTFDELAAKNPLYKTGYRCDGCGASWSGNHQERIWHCDSCRYDLCQTCFEKRRPKCPSGHPFEVFVVSQLQAQFANYRTGYKCDKCKSSWQTRQGSKEELVFHCVPCEYDLCPTCQESVPASEPAAAPSAAAAAAAAVPQQAQVGISKDIEDKVVKSALVIMPPQELWGPIQALRKEHDKAYDRWPPHINVLYPFVPESAFPEALAKLNAAVSWVPKFTVRLDKLGFFNFGKSCTMWTDPVSTPSDALQQLHQTVLSVFPHCTETSEGAEGFRPHLTLGQFPGKAATEEMISRTEWSPIEFTVDGLQLISRTAEDPFTVKFTAHLSGQPGQERPETVAPPKPKPQKSDDPVAIDSSAEEKMVTMVERWIGKNEQRNLPKTRKKLCQSIAPMLHVEYRVNVDLVIRHLQDHGFVKLVRGEKVVLSPKRQEDEDRFPVPTGTMFPEILGGVFARSRAWCQHQKAPPTKLEGLKNGLNQLCRVREPFNPETIVDILVQREIVKIDPAGNVTY